MTKDDLDCALGIVDVDLETYWEVEANCRQDDYVRKHGEAARRAYEWLYAHRDELVALAAKEETG